MSGVPLVVGRIGRAHGLRGEVAVEVRTDEPARRFTVGARLVLTRPDGTAVAPGELTIASVRRHQDRLLLGFEETADRTAAEALQGLLLVVVLAPDETPQDDEEFYDHQLVGLAVHTTDGRVVGTVADVSHAGPQDLLVVRLDDGEEALVPFVSALVPTVDLAGGRLVVDDRPGLLSPLPDEA